MVSNHGLFSKFRNSILCASFIFFLISACPTLSFSSEKIASFSADWVMTSPDGKMSSTSKLYVIPEAYRMDGMPMASAGQQGMPKDMTVLGLYPQNKQYMYNHDKKLVYEIEDENEMKNLLKTYQHVDSEEVLGKESIGGYACTKKKVTTTTTMMGMKITTTATIWQSEKFEMPLRVQNEKGYISELRNIVTKKPSEKLFETLAGYTRVDNMMAVMGMDFKFQTTKDRPREQRQSR